MINLLRHVSGFGLYEKLVRYEYIEILDFLVRDSSYPFANLANCLANATTKTHTGTSMVLSYYLSTYNHANNGWLWESGALRFASILAIRDSHDNALVSMLQGTNAKFYKNVSKGNYLDFESFQSGLELGDCVIGIDDIELSYEDITDEYSHTQQYAVFTPPFETQNVRTLKTEYVHTESYGHTFSYGMVVNIQDLTFDISPKLTFFDNLEEFI